ncbi:hypothetical protein [Inquilinus sp. CA228]|uniref:hypothetical protein n=1 Tax=Inquilinus sp. CA228 TaxID=3455609 RepID=UPI003F8D2B4A
MVLLNSRRTRRAHHLPPEGYAHHSQRRRAGRLCRIIRYFCIELLIWSKPAMGSTAALPDIVDGRTAERLAEGQAIQAATILGRPGGWAVRIRYGSTERVIAAQRSRRPRLWRNLNTAAAYVRDTLGMARFDVDATAHDPGAVDRSRPDTAERQRRAHEAAEHDRWFRAEVQKTLDGIADGSVRLIEEEEWRRIAEARRAELLRSIAERPR